MARNYRGYRGKRPVGLLVPVLIALCVVAGAISFFLHRNIAYTPEGTQVRIPGSDKVADLLEKDQSGESVDLVIEDPVIIEPVTYEARIENSVFAPIDIVLDTDAFEAFIAQVSGDRINTIVFEIKAENGKLAYASQNALTKQCGAAIKYNNALNRALEIVKEKGYNISAQISCFKDNLAPRTLRESGIALNDERLFTDDAGRTWLNAYNAEAKGYIKAIVGEVYDLGIKEVILTNLAFPSSGEHLGEVKYGKNDQAGEIASFAAELRAVADEKGGKIAAVFEKSNGQQLGDFTQSFYRIYSAIEDEQLAEAFGETVTRFVTRVVIPDEETPEQAAARIESAKKRGYGCMFVSGQGKYLPTVFQ